MFQLGFVPNLFRQAAALRPTQPIGQVLPSDTGPFAMGIRRPVGVVGAIAPWNAALILSARSIAAPLALGNAVVLKPSEWSPVSGGLLWGEIFAEAGLPGRRAERGHARARRGGADRRRAGREPGRPPDQLHRLDRDRPAARGGGRPAAQADRARARRPQPADRARRRRPRVRRQRLRVRLLPAPGPDLHVDAEDLSSSGRSPTSSPRRLAEKTKGLKAGDPKEHDTIIGPLINEQALATGGAPRRGGGRGGREGARRRRGRRPVLPGDAARRRARRTASSRGTRPSGPVAAVEVVDSADEAVEQANRDELRALAPGSSRRIRPRPRARAAARRRGSSTSTTRRSATSRRCRSAASRTRAAGRFGGQAVVDEFTELRWVTVRSGGHPFPF